MTPTSQTPGSLASAQTTSLRSSVQSSTQVRSTPQEFAVPGETIPAPAGTGVAPITPSPVTIGITATQPPNTLNGPPSALPGGSLISFAWNAFTVPAGVIGNPNSTFLGTYNGTQYWSVAGDAKTAPPGSDNPVTNNPNPVSNPGAGVVYGGVTYPPGSQVRTTLGGNIVVNGPDGTQLYSTNNSNPDIISTTVEGSPSPAGIAQNKALAGQPAQGTGTGLTLANSAPYTSAGGAGTNTSGTSATSSIPPDLLAALEGGGGSSGNSLPPPSAADVAALQPASAPTTGSNTIWLVVGLLAVAGGFAFYWFYWRKHHGKKKGGNPVGGEH